MNKIKKARITNGMTRLQLANAISCHKDYIYQLEAEKRQPSLKMLRKLSSALKIQAGELIDT